MNELTDARNSIEEIDKRMAELFCLRMNEVKKVALYKKEHSLTVKDEKREEELINKNSALIENRELRSYYINFLKSTMSLSCKYQEKLISGANIAYSGVQGAYAYIASKRIFPDGNYISHKDFKSAYNACLRGECDSCVLPIENSYAGEVGQVTDLIFSGDLFITGIFDLRICHNLLGIKGASLKDIKTVMSHPQALSQCENYIREKGFSVSECVNTAYGAKKISDMQDKTIGAIASDETALLYDLEILDHDINEDSSNTTRFAVLTRAENPTDGTFILMFTVRNEAGALAKAINIIGEYGYNMKVLRSRPVKEKSWQYYFYIEAEGNIYTENGAKMISKLQKQCEKVKIAGSYISEKSL